MSLALKSSFVLKSIDVLRRQKTHPLFAGYLHLKQRSSELDRTHDLKPDFQLFFKDYFYIEGHPIGTPYLRIFTEKTASGKNLWLNMNIAGSYAPSSLRGDQPFRKVVELENRSYSFFPDHAEKAFQFLLYGEKVKVIYLAIFLYRNFSFNTEVLRPEDLINTFAFEFGYSEKYGGVKSSEFYVLFSDHYDNDEFSDWTQVI